ncbi:hypothetical protein R3W88_032275 [Solanum pinnatisectum]|uniref:Endonuclease/exonuclease/phosphatase domain-containing protein n=1 Tax=Solanum pinnatisectum TaxID=50273 RepID=A0AAV9LNY2_9SOLN|nr:hypothetical protein R3W88_032275 [Solanum pinnatisectum]
MANWGGGDFNDLLNNKDKFGGNLLNQSRTRDFWDIVNYCEFIDLGFKGSKYTWANKRYSNRDSLIFERLDHFFAIVRHLPKTYLDHCPIMISLLKNNPSTAARIFRFETMWCSYPDLPSLIENAWSTNINLIQATCQFEVDVSTWNRHTFRNIFKRKNSILRRLEGIHNSPNCPGSPFLVELELDLIKSYNDILKQK